MKKTIIAVVLVLAVAGGVYYHQQYASFTGTKRISLDGGKYGDFAYVDGVLNGKAVVYNKNGKKSYEEEYRDGLLHGKHTAFRANGRKLLETNFLNGLKDGDNKSWDKNGTLIQHHIYKNDRLEGRQKLWNSKGILMEDHHYKNGLKDGLCRTWDKTGALLSEEYYRKGKLHGPSRIANPNPTNIPNFPKFVVDYYIDGESVLKMIYVKRAENDPSLPKPDEAFAIQSKKPSIQNPNNDQKKTPKDKN